MEHVLVLSDDIDSTRDFYCTVVGLTAGERPPLEFPGYWLYAGSTPCVHVAERTAYLRHAASLGLTGSGPVDHIAFSASDYDAVAARVDASGLPAVRNTVPAGGPRQFFVDDPNGVRIEINCR
jgi:catechol 2,3-dioxygenase-like lactoylglutathione lyase family enzyme